MTQVREGITQFAVRQLQDVAQRGENDASRVAAIQTLVQMAQARQQQQAAVPVAEWHDVSLPDLVRFALKVAVASVPAVVLMFLLYVVAMIFATIGPQLLLGGV